MKTTGNNARKSFIFNIDLLIEGETNAKALERLLHVLNNEAIADFRIQSGLQIGRLIEEGLREPALKPVNIPQQLQSKSAGNKPQASDKPAASSKGNAKPPEADETAERIRGYISANKLIRLSVNKGRGVKLSVPCRILNYDESKKTVTVYHVDEKQVYIFGLNEIDDFLQ